MFDAVIRFPRMNVAVATRDGCVSEIRYLPPSAPLKAPANELAARAASQLESYRDHPDAKFDQPLIIEGTDFQKELWRALCEIPRGTTLTYGELARRLGAESVAMRRAVGQACGDSALPGMARTP
jgi:methylated-DNA-[protein]-cysteine S-methyltransferase